MTFEDRRKLNFEAGRRELERRKEELRKQQEKEAVSFDRLNVAIKNMTSCGLLTGPACTPMAYQNSQRGTDLCTCMEGQVSSLYLVVKVRHPKLLWVKQTMR